MTKRVAKEKASKDPDVVTCTIMRKSDVGVEYLRQGVNQGNFLVLDKWSPDISRATTFTSKKACSDLLSAIQTDNRIRGLSGYSHTIIDPTTEEPV